METLFAELGLHNFSLVFDVGAHLGDKTRFFADHNISVVALEPQRYYYNKLLKYFGKNKNIHLIDKAVSARIGLQTLLISSSHPTVTTLNPDLTRDMTKVPGWEHIIWDQKLDVETTTLDSLIEDYGVPDFVKIDVEGYEYEVLQGLNRELPLLSFEFLPPYPQPALQCIVHLQTLGKYQYTFSPRETFQLSTNWLDGDIMLDRLKSILSHGDIYARLITE